MKNIFKVIKLDQKWWHMIIPALKRLKQKESSFQNSLCYIPGPCFSFKKHLYTSSNPKDYVQNTINTQAALVSREGYNLSQF